MLPLRRRIMCSFKNYNECHVECMLYSSRTCVFCLYVEAELFNALLLRSQPNGVRCVEEQNAIKKL
jgi:hypothetical protein